MSDTIGHRLRMVREARGVSALDLAEACAVTRQAVSQWEKDKYSPSIENLEKAAERLAVSLEWLRTGRGPQPDLRIVPRAGRKKPPAAPPPSTAIPPHPDMIPEQAMGIGAGPLVLDGRVHDWWKIPLGLIHETLRTSTPFLVVLRVLSDSMEPGIKLHDFVVIDQADTTPVNGKIFAIDNGVGVILCRVTVDGDKLTLRGDRNPDQAVTVARDDVRIVGRCVVAIIIT